MFLVPLAPRSTKPCALKFNHAPCDVSDLPHDVALLWFVVVGDADCVAPTDVIESVVSNIFMKLCIPLLLLLVVYFCKKVALSAA